MGIGDWGLGIGWDPQVSPTVNGDDVYTALWDAIEAEPGEEGDD